MKFRPGVVPQPRLDVFLGQGLPEQGVVIEIDLADREVVRGPPIRIHRCPLFVRQCVCHDCLPILCRRCRPAHRTPSPLHEQCRWVPADQAFRRADRIARESRPCCAAPRPGLCRSDDSVASLGEPDRRAFAETGAGHENGSVHPRTPPELTCHSPQRVSAAADENPSAWTDPGKDIRSGA